MDDVESDLDFDFQASSIIKIHVTICYSAIDIKHKIKVKYCP